MNECHWCDECHPGPIHCWDCGIELESEGDTCLWCPLCMESIGRACDEILAEHGAPVDEVAEMRWRREIDRLFSRR